MSTFIQKLQAAKTKEDIIDVVKTHDYSYMYSDDGEVWSAGQAAWEAMQNSSSSLVRCIVEAYRVYWQELMSPTATPESRWLARHLLTEDLENIVEEVYEA